MIWINCGLQDDYDEIEFQKNQLWRHFSDVIVITSPKNATNITLQNFSILGPPPNQNFWLRR